MLGVEKGNFEFEFEFEFGEKDKWIFDDLMLLGREGEFLNSNSKILDQALPSLPSK